MTKTLQVIKPDAFYTAVEKIKSGEAVKVELTLNEDVVDALFLGDISRVDVLLTLLSTYHDMSKVTIDVSELGFAVFTKSVPPPTRSKTTDLGGLDHE